VIDSYMPKPNPRRGRPATFDRSAALDAAKDLFWRHGYEGTSIAMLTEAMGFTPPTLYGAFGSKLELYREAITRYHSGGTRGDQQDLSAASPYETLERVLHAMAAQFTDPDRPRGCMVSTGSLRGGAEGGDACEVAAGLRAESMGRFVDQVEAAKAVGELPPQTDAAQLAAFYMAVVQGMSVQAIDGAGAERLHAIADMAVAAWPGRNARRAAGNAGPVREPT
jgi:TetR/AcrR family transcriptional regulator, copper-responsive repressor